MNLEMSISLPDNLYSQTNHQQALVSLVVEVSLTLGPLVTILVRRLQILERSRSSYIICRCWRRPSVNFLNLKTRNVQSTTYQYVNVSFLTFFPNCKITSFYISAYQWTSPLHFVFNLQRHPVKTPPSFPQVPAPVVDNPAFWERLSLEPLGTDTLFFAFYYQPVNFLMFRYFHCLLGCF